MLSQVVVLYLSPVQFFSFFLLSRAALLPLRHTLAHSLVVCWYVFSLFLFADFLFFSPITAFY